jgi:hypothetical protein
MTNNLLYPRHAQDSRHKEICYVPAGSGADSVLTRRRPTCHLPGETATRSTITQIYEGTNQIQRMVMARQLLK